MSLRDLLAFVVIYLVPAIPSIIIFSKLRPDQIIADTDGTILGFSIKTGGGVAAYIIFMLLAFFFAGNFIPPPPPPQIAAQFYLQLSGPRAAVQKLEENAGNLTLLLTPVESDLSPLRIGKFASQDGGQTLVALKEIGNNVLNHKFNLSLIPEPENIHVNISVSGNTNPTLIISDRNTLLVTLNVVSDDPLDVDDNIFSGSGWTEALFLTAISFDHFPSPLPERIRQVLDQKPNIKVGRSVDSLLVFMNDGKSNLGEIVLPGFHSDNPDSKPRMVEAVARRINNVDQMALSLPLRKSKNLFAQDANVFFNGIKGVIGSYRAVGSEIGYVKFVQDDANQNRESGELELRDNAFRVGPLKTPIRPGEGIALAIRIDNDFYWEPITAGLRDYVRQRAMYPTRLWLLSIRLPGGDVVFDRSSLSLNFVGTDGSSQTELPTLLKKISDTYLTMEVGVVNTGTIGDFSWRWAAP